MNAPVTADAIMRQSRGEVASQAAGIEHSRAIAEVQAAVTVAQRCPRDETAAIEKAIASCRTWEVASTAFFKLPRGKESVTGETIRLAEELARCWGNIDYGIMELARDDAARQSEMLAFAWDLETNTKSRMTFIVPHMRDKKGGPVALIDMAAIYENNANNGARRLRECIFRVLPPYLKEAAKAVCFKTLEKGKGDKSLEVRSAEAVEAFKGIGIARDRLEARAGPVRNWTAIDIANLEVSFMSIRRNEVSAEDEFPRAGVDETVDAARAIADQAKAERQHAAGRGGHGGSRQGDAQNEVTEADDGSPAAMKARELAKRAEAITDPAALEALRAEAKPHLGFMSDELAVRVTDALIDAEARIAGQSEKGSK